MALAGDRAAAQELVERHRRGVTAVTYRALGDFDDAGDVAQETLVYAIARLPQLEDHARFEAWLKQIALSQCADYRRRRGTRRLGEPLAMLDASTEDRCCLNRLVIDRALAELSISHRTAVLLHYVGGWSLEETASLLDIPLNTVRSQLMAAKRRLRPELWPLVETRTHMPAETDRTIALSRDDTALIHAAFPEARILSVDTEIEPWMPFSPRVKLKLAKGEETTVDFRRDIDPQRAELLTALRGLGIPSPRIVHGPAEGKNGRHATLCKPPAGENLLLWALGGTPHRIRLATERAFEAIDRLQGVTDKLQSDPAVAKLPRRTIAEELKSLADDSAWAADPWLASADRASNRQWRADSWFDAALAKVSKSVADIDPDTALVFTDNSHFFPLSYRIQPGDGPFDTPLGWPGDTRLQQNPVVEFVQPWGHFGDPLLGLAMVWIYDCYPFVHTGFVEQYLWRKEIGRRDFAARLALRGLQVIARELPVEKPAESGYWDALHGWVEQAIGWM